MILKIVDDDRQTCVIVTRIDRCKDLSSCDPWGASFVDQWRKVMDGLRHGLSQAREEP